MGKDVPDSPQNFTAGYKNFPMSQVDVVDPLPLVYGDPSGQMYWCWCFLWVGGLLGPCEAEQNAQCIYAPEEEWWSSCSSTSASGILMVITCAAELEICTKWLSPVVCDKQPWDVPQVYWYHRREKFTTGYFLKWETRNNLFLRANKKDIFIFSLHVMMILLYALLSVGASLWFFLSPEHYELQLETK